MTEPEDAAVSPVSSFAGKCENQVRGGERADRIREGLLKTAHAYLTLSNELKYSVIQLICH